MAQDGNLFAALFPTEAEQIQKIAQQTGAPEVGPTIKTQAPVVAFRKTTAGTSPSTLSTGAGGITLTQPVTPKALTAAYLAAQALGDATLELISEPLIVTAQGAETFAYAVPTEQVLVLLEPLTVESRRHAAAVTATVVVDNQPVLENYALTHDEGVLLAAESVVTHSVTVTFANGDWTDTTATVVLSGVLVSTQTYQSVMAPILQGVVQMLNQGGIS
ncbi:hypothetical protein [Sulfobacillus harzensis]|uniref:Uncharacterized protein n=1 Tax=Sulfobacillus harzensis TaxID=2729629 RepID=A0A7Y0Q3I2_9FIRM|nr:hypothetical protein [Sulfobacillus harzensis]NMP22219.1 hypothetical protein [Sulfobacillus harzensis]